MELDKQGRVNLPNHLSQHAQLEKECMVLGVSNRVEIWSKPVWDGYYSQSQETFNDIAEKLADFDLNF